MEQFLARNDLLRLASFDFFFADECSKLYSPNVSSCLIGSFSCVSEHLRLSNVLDLRLFKLLTICLLIRGLNGFSSEATSLLGLWLLGSSSPFGLVIYIGLGLLCCEFDRRFLQIMLLGLSIDGDLSELESLYKWLLSLLPLVF